MRLQVRVLSSLQTNGEISVKVNTTVCGTVNKEFESLILPKREYANVGELG